MLTSSWLVALAIGTTLSSAAPPSVTRVVQENEELAPRAAPTVTVASGTFIGENGNMIERFFGIRYAQPPTGNRRYRLPEVITDYSNTTYTLDDYGNNCPQHGSDDEPPTDNLSPDAVQALNSALPDVKSDSGDSEDCLNLNIVRPKPAYRTSNKLPVLVWIYGGGFTGGKTKTYPGQPLVRRSILNNAPVIFVSMNYRLGGFGFLASKEVREAQVGNLGLQDQRAALRWIQKHISAFGGDPTKVTIWGESAGAISAALHMVANDGDNEGLFRGAFMQSGAPIPVGPIENGQKYYDQIVADVGCSAAADTLACLRTVPYATLKAAADKTPGSFSYQGLNLAWLPREDGVFLTDNPQKLVLNGKVSPIPYVTGNCDDEGTLFSLNNLNVTTDAEFRSYLKNTLIPTLSTAAVDQIATFYPSTLSDGSPFDTGILNGLTPQFKRISALQGDAVFQAPRRFLLEHTASKQNAWAYVSKNFKAIPVLGAFHATDLVNSFFLDGPMSDHVLNFANTLVPDASWPKWTSSARDMLVYWVGTSHTTDTYRAEQMTYLNQVLLESPV